MKTAFTLATPEVNDPNILALRGDMRKNLALLADNGYDGAELMVRDVRQLDPVQIAAWCRDLALEIAAISSGQIAFEDGLTISSPDAKIVQSTIERMKLMIDFTAAVGCSLINVGTIRGRLPNDPAERAQLIERAAGAFREIAGYAAARGVAVAVEPQSRYVVNWHNTVGETLAWLSSAGAEDVKILFDVYHAYLEEASVAAVLVGSFSRIAHVQVSDTNRQAPGKGHFAFPSFFRWLRALGYKGFISAEIVQRGDAGDDVKFTANRFKEWLDEEPLLI